jgi:CHRD domain
MTRARFLVALALLSFLTISTAQAQTLGAVLTGSQEVPPNTNPGFGNATVTFNEARTQVTVTITVANLGAPINNFHIHESAAGANGPVRVDLIGLGGTFNNGVMTGTFPIAADVAARMLANPQNFYVNVHTTALPGGAVRGQLAYVSGGTITYAADLRASNEVPPAASNAFGSAFVTLDLTNRTIAWDVATSGIANPTLSHIHRGAAGVNGPVIINFATSAAAIAGGRTSGSSPITVVQSANLTDADLTALATATGAAGYYVNVHSQAFPGGEVRGQLVPAREYDIPVAGRVTGAQGQTFVTDVRIFNPSYTSTVTALVEFLPAGSGGNATSGASRAVTIAPRGTAALDDVTGAAFLNISGVIGALRVTSASELVVTSRIYADFRSTNRGTLGQFVPAVARGAGLRRGVLPQLAQSADPTSGFRTNIGLFNPNPSPVTVRLELRDDAGTLFGQTTLTLAAQSQQQVPLTTLFTGVEHMHSGTMTLSFDAAAPIVVYAAVNDNVSSDSYVVMAQGDSGVAANQ